MISNLQKDITLNLLGPGGVQIENELSSFRY